MGQGDRRDSLAQYEILAKHFHPKPNAARDWARLARRAGQKYMVMTTKHHEGFCHWDSQLTDYNSTKQGPGRDLVREFVEAARAEGLRVGFYYSLMDWHHPDGATCKTDEAARQRFVAYTHGLIRELNPNPKPQTPNPKPQTPNARLPKVFGKLLRSHFLLYRQSGCTPPATGSHSSADEFSAQALATLPHEGVSDLDVHVLLFLKQPVGQGFERRNEPGIDDYSGAWQEVGVHQIDQLYEVHLRTNNKVSELELVSVVFKRQKSPWLEG